MLYEIIISNAGGGTADNNSIFITDQYLQNTRMYVGDLGVTGGGLTTFTNGSSASG